MDALLEAPARNPHRITHERVRYRARRKVYVVSVVRQDIQSARITRWERLKPRDLLLITLAASALLHLSAGVLSAWLANPTTPAAHTERIELAVIEPPPPVVLKKPKPAPIKTVVAPPPEAPPPPVVEAPKPTPPPVLITGISLSSTTKSGAFTVAAGNTLQGQIAEKAVAPERVKPYKAEEYAPLHLVSNMPECPGNLSAQQLNSFYPPAAKKLELEAEVRVKMIIDFDGSVAQAKAMNDPGHGFAAAAERVALAQKCSPARVSGRAVATEVEYTIPFILEKD